MALSRISAVSAILPMQLQGKQTQAAVGDVLQLVLVNGNDNGTWARTPTGQLLRLSGLAPDGRIFAEGEVLQVRVLANVPVIELEVITPAKEAAKPSPLPPIEPAAMHADQVVLAQIAARLPSAVALAAYLQSLVSGRTQASDALQQKTYLPPGCYDAIPPETTSDAGSSRALVPANGERWMFPLSLADGTALLLQIGNDAEDANGHPAYNVHPLVLRIDLLLPDLGRVAVQVHCRHGLVILLLAYENPAAEERMRQLLPDMESALRLAGFLSLRCCLTQGLPRFSKGVTACMRAIPPAPDLFRVLAEAVLLLRSSCA